MPEFQLVVGLDGADYPLELIGGKAASLSRLRSFGAPVPPASAVTTDAYRRHSRRIGVPDRVSAVNGRDLAEIRGMILDASVEDQTRRAIADALSVTSGASSPSGSFAVRSSATTEDSPEFSFAGLHDTALAVSADPEAIEGAVRACWASLWSDRSVDYRRRGGESLDGAAMGVVIQELVRTDVAFVAFSANPLDHCARQVIISVSYGLGEAVVAGLVVPDHVVIGSDGAVESYEVGSKETMIIPEPNGTGGIRQVKVPGIMARQQSLTNDQAMRIGEIARNLEARFGAPLDIEGGILNGQIVLFQARPITTCMGQPHPSQSITTRSSNGGPR